MQIGEPDCVPLDSSSLPVYSPTFLSMFSSFLFPTYSDKQTTMILDTAHFAAYDLPLVHFSPRKRVNIMEEIMDAEVPTTSRGERKQDLSGK